MSPRGVLATVALSVAVIATGCEKSAEQASDSRSSAQPQAQTSIEEGQSETRQGTATLVGRIRVSGSIPDLPPLVAAGATTVKDAAVCSAQEVPDESFAVGDNGGLANVFVYARAVPTGWNRGPVPQGELRFDQKACRFLKHASIVHTGQVVRVLNSDTVIHNTHTLTNRNARVNQINPASDQQGLELTYESSEPVPVQITCDFHTWMRAYQLVQDHGFAAITDENGEFQITGLPNVEMKFRVWHERAGFLERNLTVAFEPEPTSRIDLDYPLEQFIEIRQR